MAKRASPRLSHGAKPSYDQLAVTMPVSVWVDGDDPNNALSGQTCLVGRDSIRLRVPQAFPPGTSVRVKTPLRSRSLVGQVRATSNSADRRMEMLISADGAGAYIGVTFPKEENLTSVLEEVVEPQQGSEQENLAPAPPEEPQAEVTAEVLPPAEEVSEPPPLVSPPKRFPEEVPSRRFEVVISGIDCARCAFSQPATAALDASGSVRVHLRQLVDLGSRVRLVIAGREGPKRDRHWHCRVYSRSPLRTPEGSWIYRLVFENVLDLFRELDLPAGEGASGGGGRSDFLLAEVNALRAVVVALLYELRLRGFLEDDTLLTDVLRRDSEPGPL